MKERKIKERKNEERNGRKERTEGMERNQDVGRKIKKEGTEEGG
jgi:hypothetical protein